MADPFATADDVAARWRPLTSAEEDLADILAGDASTILRARFPGIDSYVAADVLTLIVAGMVKRAMIAPDEGVSQDSETLGPYSHSQSFANPMRDVYLTAVDLLLIEGNQPRGGTFGYGNTTTQVAQSYPTVYGL